MFDHLHQAPMLRLAVEVSHKLFEVVTHRLVPFLSFDLT